jgi:hypothetical protein
VRLVLIHEPAFLGLVDDFERDAGAPANPIEKGVAVSRLADGTGRNRPDLRDPIAVHDAPESFQRTDDGIERLGPDRFQRERIAAQQYAFCSLLEHAGGLAGRHFPDGQADGARPHVEHAHHLWRDLLGIVHIQD